MKRIVTSSIIVVLLFVVTCQTRADMYDQLLGTGSGEIEINGAWFYNSDPGSTGTGNIQPFLRIQKNGIEQGYNTDYRAAKKDDNEYPEMIDPWTQSLLLSNVPTVDIEGTLYREFLLDLNQNNSAEGRYISLDALEIYQADAGNLTGHSTSGLGTLVYELGLDDDEEANWIILDATLNSGSGGGDMFAYIPDSLFGVHDYVYLYSMFGVHNAANATFEEWAVRITETPSEIVPTPAPGAILLGMLGFAIAGVKLRKYA
ncbi:MAG: hypothetical protein JW715_11525 [Sedimentisphaerales bacterium]|nr:hypothetical protein [Sedimentisphaerales bacterium]